MVDLDMLAIGLCNLACGAFALRSLAFRPTLTPPASECPTPPGETGRSLTDLVLTLVTLVLLVSLVGRALLADVAPPSSHAAHLVAILAAAAALNVVFCSYAPLVRMTRNERALPLAGAAAIAIHLGLSSALIPTLGLEGAAAATLATFAFLAGLTLHLSERSSVLVLERARLSKIVFSAAIVYVAAARWPAVSSWAWLSAHVAVALIGFPVVLALSGFWHRRERTVLHGLSVSNA